MSAEKVVVNRQRRVAELDSQIEALLTERGRALSDLEAAKAALKDED